MGYLRQFRAAHPTEVSESSCVAAYEKELDYLFATLQRLGATPRELEDHAQEIFLVLHRNWPTLDLTRPLRPYIFGVAFRVVSANRRKRSREIPYADLETEDEATGPERALQSKESAQLLLAALDTVPLHRRAVLIMHDLDGFPIVEVAEKLSLTRFGAYARLRKARAELASALRRLLREGSRK